MAIIRDYTTPANILKINADGSTNTLVSSGTVAISGTVAVSGTVTSNAGTGTFTVGGTVNANSYAAGAVATAANPIPSQISQSGAVLSATNPLFTSPSYNGAAVGISNRLPVVAAVSSSVTSVGTANTALTVTIPASGVGTQFTHISAIYITRANGATASVAGTAAASITTTNIPGPLQFRYSDAGLAAATVETGLLFQKAIPIKTITANTATTIVLPAPGATATTVYWLVTVDYFYAQ